MLESNGETFRNIGTLMIVEAIQNGSMRIVPTSLGNQPINDTLSPEDVADIAMQLWDMLQRDFLHALIKSTILVAETHGKVKLN